MRGSWGPSHSLFLITPCLSDTSDTSSVYLALFSFYTFAFLSRSISSALGWGDAATFSVRFLTWKGLSDLPADRGVAALSLSPTHSHSRDQQVISQPAGWPGVIWGAVYWQIWYSWAKKSVFLPVLLCLMLHLLHIGKDENQLCGLCSAAETSSIKLAWIFRRSPSGTCWSWAGLSTNWAFQTAFSLCLCYEIDD